MDDPDDRKDVMQSVAENLIKHLPTIKGLPDKAVAAYIAYAVRNTAINYYKATEQRKKRFVSLNLRSLGSSKELIFRAIYPPCLSLLQKCACNTGDTKTEKSNNQALI